MDERLLALLAPAAALAVGRLSRARGGPPKGGSGLKAVVPKSAAPQATLELRFTASDVTKDKFLGTLHGEGYDGREVYEIFARPDVVDLYAVYHANVPALQRKGQGALQESVWVSEFGHLDTAYHWARGHLAQRLKRDPSDITLTFGAFGDKGSPLKAVLWRPKVGDKVGQGRWPFSGAHPDAWQAPVSGVVKKLLPGGRYASVEWTNNEGRVTRFEEDVSTLRPYDLDVELWKAARERRRRELAGMSGSRLKSAVPGWSSVLARTADQVEPGRMPPILFGDGADFDTLSMVFFQLSRGRSGLVAVFYLKDKTTVDGLIYEARSRDDTFVIALLDDNAQETGEKRRIKYDDLVAIVIP
jgi:hypothetical protein